MTDGGVYEVRNMREWQEERGSGVVQRPVRRLFTLELRVSRLCAALYRMRAKSGAAQTAGEQALLAQRIVERLWREAMSE